MSNNNSIESDIFPLSSVVKCGLSGCDEMANLKVCSKCKNQWYCSVDHQKAHWTIHKPVCKKPEATTKPKPSVSPSASLFPQSSPQTRTNERYTLAEMPDDIVPVYASRREITIRHGYNLMDTAIKEFFIAMRNDTYPIEDTEGLLGIQMEPAQESVEGTMQVSLGNLVYLTWRAIWMSKYTKLDEERKAFRNEIVMIILLGKLPEWWQLEVMEFSQTKEGRQTACVNQLIRRGLNNIKYDTLLYKFCWGEISEKDIEFLQKTAT